MKKYTIHIYVRGGKKCETTYRGISHPIYFKHRESQYWATGREAGRIPLTINTALAKFWSPTIRKKSTRINKKIFVGVMP